MECRVDARLEEFSSDGALSGGDEAGPLPAGETIDGALAVPFTLKAGESRTASFALAWYFPNARHGHGKWGGSTACPATARSGSGTRTASDAAGCDRRRRRLMAQSLAQGSGGGSFGCGRTRA